MANSTKIYDLLKQDHYKVKQLLEKLVSKSENDEGDWSSLVDEIRDELIPHARAEESIFYNLIREVDPSNGVIAHSYAEHAMAETDLRALQAMKAVDVNWTALARKLRDDVFHHIEEEEGKVFDAARKVFSAEESAQIGKAFEKLKPSIREQGFMGTSIDLIVNLLPPRLGNAFKEGWAEGGKRSA